MDDTTSAKISQLSIKIYDHGILIFEGEWASSPIFLGRELQNEIALPQFEFISRRHLEFVFEENRILIRDLSRKNYFLNGEEKIAEEPVGFTETFDIHLKSLRISGRVDGVEEEVNMETDLITNEPANIFFEGSKIIPFQPAEDRPPQVREVFSDDGGYIDSLQSVTPIANHQFPFLPESHLKAAQLEGSPHLLEAKLFWKDNLLDSAHLQDGALLSVGPLGSQSTFEIPSVESQVLLADFRTDRTKFLIPHEFKYNVFDSETQLNEHSLETSKVKVSKQASDQLRLKSIHRMIIHLPMQLKLTIRAVPSLRQLGEKSFWEVLWRERKHLFIVGIIFAGLVSFGTLVWEVVSPIESLEIERGIIQNENLLKQESERKDKTPEILSPFYSPNAAETSSFPKPILKEEPAIAVPPPSAAKSIIKQMHKKSSSKVMPKPGSLLKNNLKGKKSTAPIKSKLKKQPKKKAKAKNDYETIEGPGNFEVRLQRPSSVKNGTRKLKTEKKNTPKSPTRKTADR